MVDAAVAQIYCSYQTHRQIQGLTLGLVLDVSDSVFLDKESFNLSAIDLIESTLDNV